MPALSTDYASIQNYTEQWVEQLDRGGLYRISNEVTLLQLHGMLLKYEFHSLQVEHVMEQIELITRKP